MAITEDSADAGTPAVAGINTAANGIGVEGTCETGSGVRGRSKSGRGVQAESQTGYGLRASSETSAAVDEVSRATPPPKRAWSARAMANWPA
jgi:hypothetical protein